MCRQGVVPFPRCARCHEQLLKCRYCAHYDARLLDCVSPFRPEAFPIRDPDLYLACPHHKTTLAAPRPVVRRRVWLPSVALFGVAIAIGVAVMLRLQAPPPRGPVLHTRIAPTEEGVVGEPLIMTLQVWNAGPGAAREIVVSLDRSCEKRIKLESVEPEPVQRRRTRGAEHMWFGRLEEGQVLDVALHMTPLKCGKCRMQADVASPDSDRRDRVKTLLEISS
jgi:hypothetical protein